MGASLVFTSNIKVDGKNKEFHIKKAFCIGYSGRDKEKTFAHIRELARIGVPEPTEIPMLYPVSVSTLTQKNTIEVIGEETSGEAEIVIIFGNTSEEVYVTVGSDHTDRSLETIHINKSKQVCSKPFANKAWCVRKIKTNWDKLILSSSVFINEKWQKYQFDSVSSIIRLEEIEDFLIKKYINLENTIVFCGTVPLVDGFKYGEKFRMELIDPVNKDTICAEYCIKNLSRM